MEIGLQKFQLKGMVAHGIQKGFGFKILGGVD